MLFSKYREDRLVALSILTNNYLRGDEAIKEAVFDLYLNNTRLINNWDLVEASAPQIVGAFLWETDRSVLFELASSYDSWTWRITSIATFYFIKRGRFKERERLSAMLHSDKEDLTHKAVGWMLLPPSLGFPLRATSLI